MESRRGMVMAAVTGAAAIAVLFVLFVSYGRRPRPVLLAIDPGSFEKYPAVFVSLDRGEVFPVKVPLKGQAIEADLWIEPDDPEIACLSREFEGATHAGEDTKIAIADGDDFDSVRLASEPEWLDSLPKPSIASGTVFFVRSSAGKTFKIRIEDFDRSAQSLKLRCVRIEAAMPR